MEPYTAAAIARHEVGQKMDALGFEPRAFRMRSGCDTTTPCARWCGMTEAIWQAGVVVRLRPFVHVSFNMPALVDFGRTCGLVAMTSA